METPLCVTLPLGEAAQLDRSMQNVSSCPEPQMKCVACDDSWRTLLQADRAQFWVPACWFPLKITGS